MSLKPYLSLCLFAAVLLTLAALPAGAHSVVIFPGSSLESAIAAQHDDFLFDVGETGQFVVLGGHHFEYDWFNIDSQLDVKMQKPDGSVVSLASRNASSPYTHPISKEKSTLTYQVCSATFDQAGIYTIYTTYVEENGDTDSPKLMVYVGSDDTWTGWNNVIGLPAEIIPYTRTMNLRAGDVLNAKFIAGGSPVPEYTMIFSEPSRTEAQALASFDEIMKEFQTTDESIYLIYSKATSTNANGEYFTTLDEPGLWVSVARYTNENGHKDATTLIVPVMGTYDTFGPSYDPLGPSSGTETSSGSDNSSNANDKQSTPGFTALAVLGSIGLAGFIGTRFGRN